MLTSKLSSRRATLGGFLGALLGCALSVPAARGRAWAAGPKKPRFYFRVTEVLGEVEPDIQQKAIELLQQELGRRDAFTPDLGGTDPSGPALKARGLRGFDVSLRVESLSKELKQPRPGRPLKQLMMGVRVSVFGAEIPDHKLAFSGEGESMQMFEVDERRLDKESSALVMDVLADAISQAVDQAVMKLTQPSNPPSHAKSKRKRKST